MADIALPRRSSSKVSGKGRKMGRHARRPTQYSGQHARAVAEARLAACDAREHPQAHAELRVALDKAYQRAGKKLHSHKKVRLVLAMKEALTRGQKRRGAEAD